MFQLTALHCFSRCDWCFKDLSSLLSCLFFLSSNFSSKWNRNILPKAAKCSCSVKVSFLSDLQLLYIFLQRSRCENVFNCVLCLHVCMKTPVLVHRFRFVFVYSCVHQSGFVCCHWNFHAFRFWNITHKTLKMHLVC